MCSNRRILYSSVYIYTFAVAVAVDRSDSIDSDISARVCVQRGKGKEEVNLHQKESGWWQSIDFGWAGRRRSFG